MKISSRLIRFVSPSVLLISLTYAYLGTIAPGLTWANGGADGGDLITAAATGGIAHPSGYPLYLLLAGLFQKMPVGTLAFRTNLMSAFFAILTALLVYSTVRNYLILELGEYIASIAGLSAGLAIGFSPLFWSQAVITEVYTLNAFFMALIIYTSIFSKKTIQLDRWRGAVYGLAMGNHITSIFFVFGALFFNSLEPYLFREEREKFIKKIRIQRKSLRAQIIWMLSSLLVYVVLPFRAIKNPVINWGNPINVENFLWLISGEIYRAYYLQIAPLSFFEKIETSASFLLMQFGLIGILLGFLGLIVFFKGSKLYILTIWVGVVSWLTFFIYQSPDSYLYLIPAFISFSVWIGISVGFSMQFFKKHNFFVQLLFLVVLISSLALGIKSNWKDVDASENNHAENFVKEVFDIAPENAIVFSEGDQAIFSLWYFHFALKERSDLIILATDLLHYDWYQESMRTAYPSLVLTAPFPWVSTVVVANPERDICYVEYKGWTEILCTKNTKEFIEP